MINKRMRRNISLLLVAALLLPLGGCMSAEPVQEAPTEPQPETAKVTQLAAPAVPEADSELSDPKARGLAFWRKSIAQFLQGSDGENRICSPVNLYLALAMLAETTDGESCAQLLSLLDVDSLQTLRQRAAAIWTACAASTEDTSVQLGNSMWLRGDIPYQESTLRHLAEDYFASAFAGEMGSEAYQQALQRWIDEQTGSLLADQTKSLQLDPNTVLALVSTLWLKAPWQKQFSEKDTVNDLFHAPNGDRNCDYLCESCETTLYRGENFLAVGKKLVDTGAMYFLLPDEGVTPEALLQDEEALRFLAGEPDAVNSSRALVHLRLPKFDVSSQLSLIDGLKQLGVVDVFDDSRADFTPLTTAAEGLYVSEATHGVRVRVNEEGCEAAAYTMIVVTTKTARPVAEEVNLYLDRPFLFGVVTADGLPLFTGVVQTPGSAS